MPIPIPYRDEHDGHGTHKRRYLPKGDAESLHRVVRNGVRSLTNKRGKAYSRADRRKIVAERWQAYCEFHASTGGV